MLVSAETQTDFDQEQFPGSLFELGEADMGELASVSELARSLSDRTEEFLRDYGGVIRSAGSIVLSESVYEPPGFDGSLQQYNVLLRVDDADTVTWQESCLPTTPTHYPGQPVIAGHAGRPIRWATAVQLQKGKVRQASQATFDHQNVVSPQECPADVAGFIGRLNRLLGEENPSAAQGVIRQAAMAYQAQQKEVKQDRDTWIECAVLDENDTDDARRERTDYLIENHKSFPRSFKWEPLDPTPGQAKKLKRFMDDVNRTKFMDVPGHAFIIPLVESDHPTIDKT